MNARLTPYHASVPGLEVQARTLLGRIEARNADCLAELHRMFCPALVTYLKLLTLPPDVVQDIVAEILMEVWCHPRDVPPDRRMVCWLAASAHQLALHHLRSAMSATPALAEGGHDPFHSLAPVQRAALGLVYVFGLSRAEVAPILGCTSADVVARIRRIRQTLRQRRPNRTSATQAPSINRVNRIPP